jgi:hypothetical protein
MNDAVRTRLLRLACAVAATVLGLLLVLLEKDHFQIGVFLGHLELLVLGAPVFAVFALLSWGVFSILGIIAMFAAAILLALPFRVTRTEVALWALYAVLLGPAFGAIRSTYVNATYRPPPGARRVCLPPPNQAVCTYEVTNTPYPVPTGATNSTRAPFHTFDINHIPTEPPFNIHVPTPIP